MGNKSGPKLHQQACELCAHRNDKMPGPDGRMTICCKCILGYGKPGFKPTGRKED